jgi:hypothetical protein
MTKQPNRNAAPGMHWCYKCQRYFPFNRFSKGTRTHGLQNRCLQCDARRRAERTFDQFLHDCFVMTRSRAIRGRKDYGIIPLPFNLTEEEYRAIRLGRCAICIALGLDCAACAAPGALREVDRIDSDPTIGYVHGNVQSLCYRHNCKKSDAMTMAMLLERVKEEPRFRVCGNSTRHQKKGTKKSKGKRATSVQLVQNLLPFPAPPEQSKPPSPEQIPLLPVKEVS